MESTPPRSKQRFAAFLGKFRYGRHPAVGPVMATSAVPWSAGSWRTTSNRSFTRFFENLSFTGFKVRNDRWPQHRWSWACALRG